MFTIRQERAAELLYQELLILIGNELDDPLLELLTVTHVVVSRDLRVAKVYVHQDNSAAISVAISAAIDEMQQSTILARLKRATPFLRHKIAQRVKLRAVPELLFYYDETPAQAARVDELLQRIAEERQARQEAAPAYVQKEDA